MESEEAKMIGSENAPAVQGTYHPRVCFFHCFFKVLAVLSYLLCQLFSMGFVLNFIVCVLLMVCDFWTVKNVTGRILVGLRWWNEVKPDGTNEWVFESWQDERPVHPKDKQVFWLALNVTPVVWTLLGIGSLLNLNLHWLLICAIGTVLSFSNTYGYYKCRRGRNKQRPSNTASQVQEMVARQMVSQFAKSAMGGE